MAVTKTNDVPNLIAKQTPNVRKKMNQRGKFLNMYFRCVNKEYNMFYWISMHTKVKTPMRLAASEMYSTFSDSFLIT